MIQLSHAHPWSHHIRVRPAKLLQLPIWRQSVCLLKHHPPRALTTYVMVTTVPTAHSTEVATSNGVLHNHFPGSEYVGVLSASMPLRVQLLLALPDENSLHTKGRVSGYWNQRQGVWLFRFSGRVSGYLESEVGRVSGYLELAPLSPISQLGHCRHIQMMLIPEKGPFVNRKCWGVWKVGNLYFVAKKK